MKGYRKVLIAVNGSGDVLDEGLKLAMDEKCWVTVVKVVPPNDGELNLTGIKNIDAVLGNGSSEAINEINGRAKAEGALIKTRLEEGDVHKKIVEVAEEERCDLIIMGAQKVKKGIRRFFGVNIVEKVIESAPCPVLVVAS
jgi:nucleotide-binding universal stress UspA family protein